MTYTLRKRNAVNYNDDIIYERIFAECDEDVKECVLTDEVEEDIDDEIFAHCESVNDEDEMMDYLELKTRVRQGLLKVEHATCKHEKLIEVISLLDDSVDMIDMYESADPQLSRYREAVVNKLNSFMLEVPEHAHVWIYYLNNLGCVYEEDKMEELPMVEQEKCECGETSMFGSECATCFLQKEFSTRLCFGY